MLWDALGLAGDGAHHDDAAADGEVLVGFAGDEELAAGVDGHDAVVLLLGHVLEVAEGDDARVGHGDVELPIVGDGFVEELDRLLYVRHVGLERDGVTAVLLDRFHHLVGHVERVGIIYDDRGAAVGELHSDGRADTTACEPLVGGGVLLRQRCLPEPVTRATLPSRREVERA